jgi:hypothetical protein
MGVIYRRKKLEIVEARQVPSAPMSDYENSRDSLVPLAKWWLGEVMTNTSTGEFCIDHGMWRALPTDWMIKESDGRRMVLKDHIFREIYEVVT